MMIAPNSRARREKKKWQVNEEYGRISGEEEGDAGYGEMMRLSQQDMVPCEKGIEQGEDSEGEV